jgi:hypothetical protein
MLTMAAGVNLTVVNTFQIEFQGSAQPPAKKTVNLIENETLAM